MVDKPGVLAGIAGALGRCDISVASVLQHEPTRPDSVPLVITTHEAQEGNVTAAIREIQDSRQNVLRIYLKYGPDDVPAMIGSRRTGLAFFIASLKARDAAILNAISEESTS